jgi:hypothetical protein
MKWGLLDPGSQDHFDRPRTIMRSLRDITAAFEHYGGTQAIDFVFLNQQDACGVRDMDDGIHS